MKKLSTGLVLGLLFFSLIGCSITGPLQANAAQLPGFADVAATDWFADAVEFCNDKGWLSGVSATEFSPRAELSRGMLLTVLHRQAMLPDTVWQPLFFDVPKGQWFSDGVLWGVQTQLAKGYDNGNFGVHDPICREEIALILWRYAGSPTPSTAAQAADHAAIAPYAADAVSWVWQQGLMQGKTNGIFDPKGALSRGEAAVILQRWDGLGLTAPVIPPVSDEDGGTQLKLTITIDNKTFSATLYDNEAARALSRQLPMTIAMDELNGNEKFYYLPGTLPTSAGRPSQIHAGDLMLYGSDCLVLFYETFSTSYSYTPLGVADDPSGLAEALGPGSVTVTFS